MLKIRMERHLNSCFHREDGTSYPARDINFDV